jgi:hypothetical protein
LKAARKSPRRYPSSRSRALGGTGYRVAVTSVLDHDPIDAYVLGASVEPEQLLLDLLDGRIAHREDSLTGTGRAPVERQKDWRYSDFYGRSRTLGRGSLHPGIPLPKRDSRCSSGGGGI